MIKFTRQTLLSTACVAAVLGLSSLTAHAGKTVDAIKARGQLICGVNEGLAGFSAADSQGKWTGMTSMPARPSPRPSWVMPARSSGCR